MSNEFGSNKVGEGEGGLPSLEEVEVGEVLCKCKLVCQGNGGEVGDVGGTWEGRRRREGSGFGRRTVQCKECGEKMNKVIISESLEREKVRLFSPSVESSWAVSTFVDCHLNRREMLNGTLPCRMEETRGWMKWMDEQRDGGMERWRNGRTEEWVVG